MTRLYVPTRPWLGTEASQNAARKRLCPLYPNCTCMVHMTGHCSIPWSAAHCDRKWQRIGLAALLIVAGSFYLIATPADPLPVPDGPGWETCTEKGC